MRRDPDQPALPGLEPVVKPRGYARRAVAAQLREQRKLGQIEPVDAGVIGVARMLADLADGEVLDGGSRYTAAMILTRLDVVLARLRGERIAGDVDGTDVELAELVAALRDTPRPDETDPG